jgi:hypothetical protein
MSSSETESTASDLSHEQEIGEVGEVDEGHLQPYKFEPIPVHDNERRNAADEVLEDVHVVVGPRQVGRLDW